MKYLVVFCVACTSSSLSPPGATELERPPCSNGLRDFDETDVDCGGSCSACADFRGCSGDEDCQSGVCMPSSLCAASGPRLLGGQIAGLEGMGLVIEDAISGVQLSPVRAGAFFFSMQAGAGTYYEIRVVAQPTQPAQVCTVSNEAGRVMGDNVVTVLIECATVQRTLGGVAHGVPAAGVELRNGRETLRVTADGAFAFATTLDDGVAYDAAIVAQPEGRSCSLVRANGYADADVSSMLLVCLGDVSIPFGTGQWSNYVQRDSVTTACDEDDPGNYFACIHTGEKRTLALPFVTSCAGVTAHDELNALEWWCDDRTQPVTMRSMHMKRGTPLYALLRTTAPVGFRENRLIIEIDGATASTVSSMWWQNTVQKVPSGATPQLSLSNTVYFLDEDSTRPMTIVAPHVTLAAEPSALVSVNSGQAGVYCNPHPFAWVDGVNVLHAGTAQGISIYGKRAVIRGAVAVQEPGAGRPFALYTASMMRDSYGWKKSISGSEVLDLDGVGGVVLDSHFSGGHPTVSLSSSSLLSGVTLTDYGTAVSSPMGDAIILRTLAPGGATFMNVSDDDTIIGATVINHSNAAVSAFGAAHLEDIVFANNFEDVELLGGAQLSAAVQATPEQAATFWVSPNDDDPVRLLPDYIHDDLNRLLDPFRVWVNTTGAPFSTTIRGLTCSGTCRLMTYTLADAASLIRDVRSTPSAMTAVHAFNDTPDDQDECDRSHPGSLFEDDRCKVTRVRHAYEVLQDDVGNDDGLCSAGERCVWLRHAGADQGPNPPVFIP